MREYIAWQKDRESRAHNRLLDYIVLWIARWDGRFDPAFADVLVLVLVTGNTSISHAQRHLRLPYRRTCRMFEALERMNLVSQPDSGGFRQPTKQLLALRQQGMSQVECFSQN